VGAPGAGGSSLMPLFGYVLIYLSRANVDCASIPGNAPWTGIDGWREFEISCDFDGRTVGILAMGMTYGTIHLHDCRILNCVLANLGQTDGCVIFLRGFEVWANLTNIEIRDTSAYRSGIRISELGNANAKTYMKNCSFVDFTGKGYGCIESQGTISQGNKAVSEIQILYCLFERCTAGPGDKGGEGGTVTSGDTTVYIDHCVFEECVSINGTGGALYLYGVGNATIDHSGMTDCFTGNVERSCFMYINGADVSIRHVSCECVVPWAGSERGVSIQHDLLGGTTCIENCYFSWNVSRSGSLNAHPFCAVNNSYPMRIANTVFMVEPPRDTSVILVVVGGDFTVERCSFVGH
jgi:hypothetical protein